jgi:glycosyltransferase involved in cell wall biosynthesis
VKVGQEHMNFSAHRSAVKRAIKRRYPKLDALVVLTEHDREEYSRVLGDSVPVERIPNAVPRLDGPTSPLTAKTVLAAGRLMRQKDFGRLIRAFDLVVQKNPDWQLRICGRGPRRRALEALIDERGLGESVVLAGAVPNLGEEMANASMLAMSSRFEGFPMVLLEAMSKGLPVASFDVPTGPRDIIDDRRNGLLVPHQDVPALAAAINELIEDEELRRRCGEGALETAERYRMAVVGPQWERLLEATAARRAAS